MTVAPLELLPSGGAGGIPFAALGLCGYLNGGGAVLGVSPLGREEAEEALASTSGRRTSAQLSSAAAPLAAGVDVLLRGDCFGIGHRLLLYSGQRPAAVVLLLPGEAAGAQLQLLPFKHGAAPEGRIVVELPPPSPSASAADEASASRGGPPPPPITVRVLFNNLT